MSRPLLAVLGVGWKEEMYKLKRPGRRKVSGELTGIADADLELLWRKNK